MIYVLAFFFPYIALLVRGLWLQAIFNFILCVIGYVTFLLVIGGFISLACSAWGIIAILQQTSKKNHQEMIDALKNKE